MYASIYMFKVHVIKQASYRSMFAQRQCTLLEHPLGETINANIIGVYTFRMSHFLHSSGSNHNRHRNIEAQNSCAYVYAAYVYEDTGSEPD